MTVCNKVFSILQMPAKIRVGGWIQRCHENYEVREAGK